MKKHEFRKGDRVVCVDNYGAEEHLKLNHIYYVVEYNVGYNMVCLRGEEEYFFAYRFELTEKRIIEYL